MKFLISLLLCLAFISCNRKKTLKDVDKIGILAKGPATCYNRIKDGDELDVDCGGSCQDCNFEIAPCSPPGNLITIGTSTLNLYPDIVNQSGQYIFEGTYTNGFSYKIELSDITPNTIKAYNLSNSIGFGTATVYFKKSGFSGGNSQDFYINKGKLYVTKTGNIYYATICNGEGYYQGTPAVFHPVYLKVASTY